MKFRRLLIAITSRKKALNKLFKRKQAKALVLLKFKNKFLIKTIICKENSQNPKVIPIFTLDRNQTD